MCNTLYIVSAGFPLIIIIRLVNFDVYTLYYEKVYVELEV